MKKYFIILMVLAVCSVLVFSQSIPDFSLKNLDGSTFKLSDHLGKKIIIIEFWATWCKPCKKFLKRLNGIYLKHKKNIIVLAVSIDEPSAHTMVNSYIKGRGFEFTVLLDPDNNVARIVNPSLKIPFTLIIDKSGEIKYTHTGYIPGIEKEIIKILTRLLLD